MPIIPLDGAGRDDVRDVFRFRSGRLALDLGATLAKRASTAPRELLASPDDLVRWLRSAGLAASGPLRATARDVSDVQALREALYRLALAMSRGDAWSKADRELVNTWASRPAPAPQLGARVASHGTLHWTRGTVRGCLAAIAQDGITLLAGPLAERVRKCDACTILFVDLSRSGSRRWCSMSACGNKAKVAAFRRRAAVSVPPQSSIARRS